MKNGLVWCLVMLMVVTGLGSAVPPAVAQDEEPTCEDRYAEAGRLLVERQNALAAGNVVLALSLIRQAQDLVAGCVPPEEEEVLRVGLTNDIVPATVDRDGIPMMVVWPGCFMMGSADGQPDEQPVHEVCFYSAYLIDQTEVTRGMYDACVAADACAPTDESPASTTADQPINRINWFQADAYCKWRGLRLPTEAEWEYAARGPEGWAYPWGNEFDSERLAYNYTVGDTTAPVGSYPEGASWVGALDMSGNVAEWVRTVYHPYPYNPAYNRGLDDVDSPRVLRGGSFGQLFPPYLTTTFRRNNPPSFELDKVGFRCVNAPAVRPEHVTEKTTCDERIDLALDVIETEAALLIDDWAAANLWTNLARDLLEPCAENTRWIARMEMFSGVNMALVPTGCFHMGRADGEEAEQPAHQMCIEQAYWIDQTEITRGMYEQCIEAEVCTPIPDSEYSTRETQPANGVTWFQARTYCGWRGARLPTEAEWEYAARGPENRLYPWGDTFVARNLVYAEEFEMGDVGSIPAGVSWVGALDMSGNAREWVSSVFTDYPYDPAQAEQPANTTAARVLRGGSFYNFDQASVSTTYRDRAEPDLDLYTNGFRCARDG